MMTFSIYYQRPPLLPWNIYCSETGEVFRARHLKINVPCETKEDIIFIGHPARSVIQCKGVFVRICREYSEINPA